ncbi:hypothetical protein FJY70_03665, partial [candidate division WOR-3 bacterium]|nr:hypothetical protein [candidate division WOR-3 bacterium]
MASEQNGTAGLAEVLTEATLQQRAYGKSYFRGVSCFERGAVENLSDFGGRLVARVRGAELYRVELWSENGLSHSCSCPVGADGLFCKHCVAAGLEWLARRSEAEPLDEPGERVERVEVTRDEVREYLSRQSNEALVGLLMRHAQADLEFAELLRARVATSRPGGPGPSFLRQMITNATRVHGDLYGHVLDSYVEEVRTALEPVWALLDAGHGVEALALAEHALKRLEKAERQAAEYNDRGLSGLLTEVEKLHLAACLWARPDP